MGYRFVPECNHTRAYMKVIHVNFFLFLKILSELQDHDFMRSKNFDTILDCKAVVCFFFFFFLQYRVCKAGGTVVIFSREARGPHRPVGRPNF